MAEDFVPPTRTMFQVPEDTFRLPPVEGTESIDKQPDLVQALMGVMGRVSGEDVPRLDALGKMLGAVVFDARAQKQVFLAAGGELDRERAYSLVREARASIEGLRSQIDQLATAMRARQSWSKSMAEAQAAMAQVKRTEVETFPLRTWPKFTVTVAAALLGAGSTLLTLVHAEWTVSSVVAVGFLYLMGAALVIWSLAALNSDEIEKRRRYDKLFPRSGS